MKTGQSGAAREYVPLLFLFGKGCMRLIKKDNPYLFFFCFLNSAENAPLSAPHAAPTGTASRIVGAAVFRSAP
jgi:hypothetical protein